MCVCLLVIFCSCILFVVQVWVCVCDLFGVMYLWEVDLEYGIEQVLYFVYIFSDCEIYVIVDVVIVQWQYYLVIGDCIWLCEQGWLVLCEVVCFWIVCVDCGVDGCWYICYVILVSELYIDVDDDIYINVLVSCVLVFVDVVVCVLGEIFDLCWKEVVDYLVLLMFVDGCYYVDFDFVMLYCFGDGVVDMVLLLVYFLLDWLMDEVLCCVDFIVVVLLFIDFDYVFNSMGLVFILIVVVVVGEFDVVVVWFCVNVIVDVIKLLFNVCIEIVINNIGYFFIVGGGLLQNVIFGFIGLCLCDGGLVLVYVLVLLLCWCVFMLYWVQVCGWLFDIIVCCDV